jgi:hypothetical protein
LAEILSNNCKKIDREIFSIEKVVDRLEQVYKEAAGAL